MKLYFSNVKHFLIFFLCLTTSLKFYAQGDNPCTATTLTENTSCTYVGGTTAGATYSNNAANGGTPGCASPGAPDVWYKFTAAATGNYVIDSNTGSITDSGMSLYSATTCSTGLTVLDCDDDDSGNGTMSMITWPLTAGTTYYIRFWRYSSGTGTFSICLTAPASPPANDNCPGAVALTVNADLNCGVQTGGTLLGATTSTQANVCGGTADDDVWYSFVATSTTHQISLNNVAGSTTDLYHSVYNGGTCGALGSTVVCSDPNSSNLTGLTIGNTYRVRVYSWTGTTGQTSTFSVCVGTPPPPPSNDNCPGAIALTVNSDLNCGTQTGGTLQSATTSTQANTCSGTADDDVWYSFVATSTSHSITLNNVAGSTTDLYHSVYNGGTCGALGSTVVCSDPNSSFITGLTVGNTYRVRVYSYTSTTGQTSTFSICVGTPPPPPSNDNPCTATTATVNSVFGCTVQTAGSLLGATTSTVGLGACFGTADDDVWFTFVANNTTQLISINNASGSTTDMYHSVHPGSCGAIGAALVCSDADNSTVTGLTVGTTYYVRVYSYTSTWGQNTTFNLCISPPPTPPANDNCPNATSVTVNSAFTCTAQTAGTIAGATTSTNSIGTCGGTADDDVWFTFVANATSQYINLNNVTGSTTDLYHAVYSGGCNSLTNIICSDPNNSIVTGLTIGNTYRVRVYSWTSTTGQTSSFSLCITPPPTPPANDNPCGAITASVNSAAGQCTLTTSGTIAGATTSTNSNVCGGTADDDVWYKFVATSTSININLLNITGSTTDLYHSVYAAGGACSTPGATLICSDPNSSTISGLTVGNTYYIRIYSYTSTTGQTTMFDLCLTPTPPPPTNVTCNQMQPICSGSPIVFQAQSSGGTAAAGPNYGCLSTQPNPTWFYLEIATPGTMAVDLTAGSDVDFALWGPYPNLAAAQASCNTYPSPLDCSYSSSNIEQMNIASVTTGQVYAVLVTNYASIVQSITLNQASGASATTNCAIVLPVSLLYFNATPNENTVDVTWETANEINSDYFEIERSVDGFKWEVITRKKGMGNSVIKTKYSHIDTKPYSGISYYRLKQVDLDQFTKYFNIVSVDLAKGTEAISNLHPNPTKENVNFDIISKTKGNVIVELIDFSGNSIYKETQVVEQGINNHNLSLSNMREGVFLLKVVIENSGKTLIQKIIKQ